MSSQNRLKIRRMKNCQSKISLATCHYCQSSWQFSQSSSPKPPLDHLTPGPNSRDSLGPAEWYRVVKHLHIDIVYNTSTFSFNPPPTPPQPRRKKWSLTRCGKDPCRIVLTQSPEWRSHTKRPLKQMLESVFRYCHLLFVITYSWPGSTCDHPMSVRCYTRESSASVLFQPEHLLGESKETWRTKTHLTRVIQNQDVFRYCHQNLVSENLQDTTFSTM